MKTLTLVQSRTHTPNYYLFKGLSDALSRTNLIDVRQSRINGFQKSQANDLLLCFGGEEALNPIIASSRLSVKKSAIWFTEDPYEFELNKISAQNYDLVMTTDYYSSEKYDRRGTYLSLGVPSELFSHPKQNYERFDLVMFGSLWPNRLEMLDRITSHPRTKNIRILLISSQLDASWINPVICRNVLDRIILAGGEIVNINRPLSIEQLLDATRNARICLNWPRLFKKDTYSVPGPRIAEVGSTYVPQLLDPETQPAIRHMVPDNSFLPYSNMRLEDDIADALEMSTLELEKIGRQMFNVCQQNFDWQVIASTLVKKLISI
jgi:hypothetical protein